MNKYKKISLASLCPLLAFTLTACIDLEDNDSSNSNSSSTQYEKSTFITGADIHSANGIYFNAADQLFIASGIGSEIVTMNPENGEIVQRMGVEDGIEEPDDLTFGPDGSLYWTGVLTGDVGKISPDGNNTIIAQGLLGVNPITFSDDGRLFAGLCLFGDALYELDPDGIEPPRLVVDGLANDVGSCSVNAMDFGSDGFLYGPRLYAGEVIRINVDSGEFSTVANGFGNPVAVKFNSQGQLHVLDTLTGEVLRVDKDSGSKEVITTLAPGLDNLAFDSQDRLYVSSYVDGTVTEVLSDGSSRVLNQGGLASPGGLAIVEQPNKETLYVADGLSLMAIDTTTKEQEVVLRSVASDGYPGAVSVSNFGPYLLISSWFDSTINIWDPQEKEMILTISDFPLPVNAIEFQGDVVVAESYTKSIYRLKTGAAPEVLASSLGAPAGLVVLDNNLWISDQINGTVLQIIQDGITLEEPIIIATDLSSPEGLAFSADGNLLVVETGAGKLSSIDMNTGEIETIASNLQIGLEGLGPIVPSTFIFNGVTVDSTGKIYLSGDKGNIIYQFDAI